MSPSRSAAFEILLRVLTSGGYASDLLLEKTADLDSRDAGLASELVFGCLRYRGQLDFLIDHYAGRPARTAPAIRVALWLGVYQLRYLDRIPRHAAVSESVEMSKRGRDRFSAGFVNAVLRKVDRNPVKWPNAAVEHSCPQWILDRWVAQFGSAQALAIAGAALAQPETYVRLPKPAPNLEPTDVPGAYRLTGGIAPPFARIQDVGSQAVVPLLELAPGQAFLDLCAAPGNKTAQALETPVRAVACDLHHHRLKPMGNRCPRVVLDASKTLPFCRKFDQILADVPCSGTGTLARNPEIKWRIEPANIAELHILQVKILTNALAVLAPGGRLVYSTCSLEREENQEVVAEVMAQRPDLKMVRETQRIPGREPGDGFYAAVLTSEYPPNG